MLSFIKVIDEQPASEVGNPAPLSSDIFSFPTLLDLPESEKGELLSHAPAFADKVARSVTEFLTATGERQRFLDPRVAEVVRETAVKLFPVLAEQNFKKIGYHNLRLECKGKDQATERDLEKAEEEHVIQHLKATLVGYEAMYAALEKDDLEAVAGLLGLDPQNEDFQQVFPCLKDFYLKPQNQLAIARLVTYTSLLHDAKESDGRLVHEDNAIFLSAQLKEEGRLDFTVDGWDLYPLVVAGIEASRMDTQIPPKWGPARHGDGDEEHKAEILLKEAVMNLHMVWVHRADYERNTNPGYYSPEALKNPKKLGSQPMFLLTGEALVERTIEKQLKVPKNRRSNLIDKYYQGVVEMMAGSAEFVTSLINKFKQTDRVLEASDLPDEIKKRFELARALPFTVEAVIEYRKYPELTSLRVYQSALLVAQQQELSEEQLQMDQPQLQEEISHLISRRGPHGLSLSDRYRQALNEWQRRQQAGLTTHPK